MTNRICNYIIIIITIFTYDLFYYQSHVIINTRVRKNKTQSVIFHSF